MKVLWQTKSPLEPLEETMRLVEVEGERVMEVLVNPPHSISERLKLAVKVMKGQVHVLSTRVVDSELEGYLIEQESSEGSESADSEFLEPGL